MPEPISTSNSSEFFVYGINGDLTTPLAQTNEQQKTSITYTHDSNPNRIGILSANYLLEVREKTRCLTIIINNLFFFWYRFRHSHCFLVLVKKLIILT